MMTIALLYNDFWRYCCDQFAEMNLL